MAHHTRRLFTEPQGNGTTLIGEISYNLGGTTLGTMMGFSSGPEQRGYYLRVRRTIDQPGSQCFILGDGYKQLVQPANRFSAKQLQALTIEQDLLADLKGKTLKKPFPAYLLTQSQ